MAIGSCSTDIAWWSLEKNIPCKIFKNISPLSVQRNLLPAVLFALPIPSWLRIVDMKPNSKSSSQVVELTPQIIQRLNVKKSKKFWKVCWGQERMENKQRRQSWRRAHLSSSTTQKWQMLPICSLRPGQLRRTAQKIPGTLCAFTIGRGAFSKL